MDIDTFNVFISNDAIDRSRSLSLVPFLNMGTSVYIPLHLGKFDMNRYDIILISNKDSLKQVPGQGKTQRWDETETCRHFVKIL